MKKALVLLFLCIMAMSSVSKNIVADEFSDTFEVNYNQDNTLTTNFKPADIEKTLSDIQPGDTATVYFKINNKNTSQAVDWWMDNQTLKTLEEDKNNAERAGYTYELIYEGSDGRTYDFFNSEIGGDINPDAGFSEATEGLQDYFKMQESSMQPSTSGTLKLSVTLDGESSGYYYQSNSGQLRLDFAVELPIEPEPKKEEKHIPRVIYIPNTGDTINLNFYFVLEIVSLLLLAIITLAYYMYNRRQEAAR